MYNKNIQIQIERLGIYGEGIGYFNGLTIFVDGALPGETIRASIYEEKKRYARAKVIEYLQVSPHRVKPLCPHFSRCGGCQFMHLSYAEQLEAKRMRVVDALERIGKFSDLQVPSCIPSPLPIAYRNKIQLPVENGPSGLRLGLYAHQTHDLVEIEKCHIHCIHGEAAFQCIKKILKNSSISAYNSQTGEGELRHVLIKTAYFTEEILVVLVTNGPASDALKSIAHEIMDALPKIKGVVQNINTSRNNVILSNDFHILAGESTIVEHLCGLFFKVSAASFFQVNPPQAQNLYEKAVEFAALKGNEIVLDAYCGVGTIALIFSKKAKEVIGVECVAEAIEDAKQNAERNGILNTRFTCANVEDFIDTLDHVDVAVLNPPRKGCDRAFLEKLSDLKPKRLVYISCDPATLARDLALLTSKGYRILQVQPFDMFPQTTHVETLALLTL